MFEDYRDFKVSYAEHNNIWTGKNVEQVELSSSDGMAGLKKKIDKHISAECKSNNITILTWGQWSCREKLEVVTITSIDESGDMWVRRPNKSINKLSLYTSVYINNESNQKISNAINKVREEMLAKQKEASGLVKSLETYRVEILKES